MHVCYLQALIVCLLFAGCLLDETTYDMLSNVDSFSAMQQETSGSDYLGALSDDTEVCGSQRYDEKNSEPLSGVADTQEHSGEHKEIASLFTASTEYYAVEALVNVLLSEESFLSGHDSGCSGIYLREFYLADEYNSFEFPHDVEFAVVDMDEDGVLDVVLNIKTTQMRLVLRFHDGYVYGYEFSPKQMGLVAIDGSFSWGYATYHGWGRLRFTGRSVDIEILAFFDYVSYYDQEIYMINDSLVTYEDYEVFCYNQNAKNAVAWHELTDYYCCSNG